MSSPRQLTRRLRLLLGRQEFERDLDDEMRFHVEMQTARNVERGMSPEAARARAKREFGRADHHKEEVRDARGLTWADDLARDVRFSLRGLRRSPAFVVVAVLCLALGIGANGAIFSVVNAVLLRPFPYAEPERLVRLYETMKDDGGFTGSVSVPNFRDWRAEARTVQQMTAFAAGNRNLLGLDQPERVQTVAASADLFTMLGVQPLRGRTFAVGEDEPGRGQVVVIGEGLWRRRFGADQSLVGRTITLDGVAYTVIGIMPAGFNFPAGATATDLWIPYIPTENAANSRGSHSLAVVGRLAPGVTVEQAAAELQGIAARIEQQYPDQQANRSAVARSLRDTVVGRSRPALLVLLGAVGLVLLIACANVANLLLARAATRRHEVAVRLALGASRARLVRQLLVESLLLALVGATAGGAVAWAALRAMRPLLTGAVPVGADIPLDWRVFVFLAGVGVLSGLIFGLAPALHASATDVRANLIDAGSKTTAGGRQQRGRSALVVAEIALSFVLLVGAGLLMRGFVLLRGTPSGLDPANVLTAHVAIPAGKYQPDEITPRLLRPILDNAREIPGVRSAAAISLLPIQSAWTNGGFTVVGQPAPEPGREPLAEVRIVSPGFFQSLGIPVRSGRDFTENEAASTILINETLARAHFPGENPIGRQIAGFGENPSTIVGVVGEVRQAGLDQAPLKEIYFPYSATGIMGWVSDMTLVVKAGVAPTSIVPALRQAVRKVDADQPTYQVMTMNEVIEESLAGQRLTLWLLGGFAATALILSAAGLYGVIAYLVTQRTREIGIRVALGAQTRDVVRLVMRHGAGLTAAGIALGLIGALAFTRVLESLLYGVSARDPLTFAGLAVVLATVALLATYLPARRAARVDPLLAIRAE